MRVRFIGDPRHGGEGPDRLSLFGVEFVKGQWVEVSDAFPKKVARHSHFEVDTDGDGQPGPTLEELRAELDAKGIAYHHKAGVKRLLELLDDAD
jgi:hypothetical protein